MVDKIGILKIGGHGPAPPGWNLDVLDKVHNWMTKDQHEIQIGYDEKSEKIVFIKVWAKKKPELEWPKKSSKK